MRHRRRRTIVFCTGILVVTAPALLGETLLLKNGSSLEGKVSMETPDFFVLQLGSGGVLRVDKKNVEKVERSFAMESAPAAAATVDENGATPVERPAADGTPTGAGEKVVVSQDGGAAPAQTQQGQENGPLGLSPTGQQLLRDMVQLMQYRNEQLDQLTKPGGINKVRVPADAELAARDRVLQTLLQARGASGSPPPPSGGAVAAAAPAFNAATMQDLGDLNGKILEAAGQVKPAGTP